MGTTRMGVPKEIVLNLKKLFHIDNFIETGTYKAQTTIWASTVFECVHTIENSKTIFDGNHDLLRKYPEINFHYGHSKKVLAKILENLKTEAIIWLDAHWSGSDTYGAHDECPLLEEIEIIYKSNPKHIILIDDARLFLSPPPSPHNALQWPNMKEIIFALNKNNTYVVIFEDVIFSVPASEKQIVLDYFQKLTTENWNQKPWNKIREGLILVKDGIMQAIKQSLI